MMSSFVVKKQRENNECRDRENVISQDWLVIQCICYARMVSHAFLISSSVN